MIDRNQYITGNYMNREFNEKPKMSNDLLIYDELSHYVSFSRRSFMIDTSTANGRDILFQNKHGLIVRKRV